MQPMFRRGYIFDSVVTKSVEQGHILRFCQGIANKKDSMHIQLGQYFAKIIRRHCGINLTAVWTVIDPFPTAFCFPIEKEQFRKA